VIEKREHGDKARFFNRGEKQAHFLAGEHRGDGDAAFDADLLPAGPVGVLEVIAEKEAQGADALVERTALVAVVFLKMMEEAEDFLLGEERGAGHATVLSETFDPTDVALFGAFTERFELDETDERV